jgi:hypothetical protein
MAEDGHEAAANKMVAASPQIAWRNIFPEQTERPNPTSGLIITKS